MNSLHPTNPLRRGLHILLQARDLLDRGRDTLQPAAAMAARLFVGKAFFLAGLTKIQDWSVTVDLFTYEYKVPLLPPEIAAVMGTAGELVLPVLLVLGLGGRLGALGLSVVNIMAVVSLMEIAPAALEQHIGWGIALAALAVFGNGSWALDRWLTTKTE